MHVHTNSLMHAYVLCVCVCVCVCAYIVENRKRRRSERRRCETPAAAAAAVVDRQRQCILHTSRQLLKLESRLLHIYLRLVLRIQNTRSRVYVVYRSYPAQLSSDLPSISDFVHPFSQHFLCFSPVLTEIGIMSTFDICNSAVGFEILIFDLFLSVFSLETVLAIWKSRVAKVL